MISKYAKKLIRIQLFETTKHSAYICEPSAINHRFIFFTELITFSKHRHLISGQIMKYHVLISNYIPLSALTDVFSSLVNDLSLQIIGHILATFCVMWILKADKPS